MFQSRGVMAAIVVVATFCCTVSANAWNATGHMAVAAIAYRGLKSDVRARLVALIHRHPWANQWLADRPSDVEEGLYLFMRASTWPDDIREGGSGFEIHARWHYVNYPLRGPAFAFKGSPFPDDDILFGLGECESVLDDASESQSVRAVYLSWMLHLVGDIHQPLHCATWIGNGFTSVTGDQGGGLVFVRSAAGAKPTKLHGFWDGLLGTTRDERAIVSLSLDLEKANPRSALAELLGATTPRAWSRESWTRARNDVYRSGALMRSSNPDTAPVLPGGYATAARTTARRCAVLAGYRLADLLSKVANE